VDVSRAVTEGIKIWLILGAIGLVVAWRWLPLRAARGLLVALTLTAGLNYSRWGPDLLLRHYDAYDLIHYYLNAKYFDELGYYDLYPAAILADHSNGGPYFKEGSRYMDQDANGHAFRSIDTALARGRLARQRFTPERWEEFEHDFLFLQREPKNLTDTLWRQMIQDHGYNGTPVWTVVARPLASLVPVEHLKWLCSIDLLLLTGALLFVGTTYGASPALWVTFFILVTYSARWPTITWAFLRYDWLAAMLVGMALVRRGRMLWAGVLTGYAAALRLFPMMWLFGPGARGIWGLFGRRIDRPLVRLALGFVLGLGGLQALAIASLGTEQAVVHFENMLDHNRAEQLSSRRIGLATALPFRGDLLPKNLPKETKALIADQKPMRLALAGLALLALGVGSRRLRNDEAYALGFLPFFLLTTASYYYFVARATLILAHAADLRRPRNVVGLVLLLALEGFSNWAETAHPDHRVFLIGGLSWGLCLYTVVMAVWLLVEAFRTQTAPQVGADAPASESLSATLPPSLEPRKAP
jgi:hypothetical protein